MRTEKGEAKSKRLYECPKLVTYGDFRSLTGSKGGNKGDGGGKASTRLKGKKS
jgi:hypothetical protein